MPRDEQIVIPDLGVVVDVTIVEILVSVGDHIEVDDGLVTLESDKASMDVPTTVAGVVKEIAIESGATVNEGDLVVVVEVVEGEEAQEEKATEEGEAGPQVEDHGSEEGTSDVRHQS